MPLVKVQSRGTENVGGGRKNLIINGAMQVAQRGTSSTGHGIVICDRFQTNRSGPDITSTQHTLSTSDTPYSLGFRSSYQLHITDPQTPDTATDYAEIGTKIESQDIAQSGWDYTSTSSKITLSFWVLSTVGGTYTVLLRNSDSNYSYTFNYTVSANTWKKVTHTISGNSNLVFNDDNGIGLLMFFTLYYGTNYTATATNEAWASFDSNVQVGDYAQNILATDEAKFEITGIQLEVGSQASDFQFESFGETLSRCQRYFFQINGTGSEYATMGAGQMYATTSFLGYLKAPVPMRSRPSFSLSDSFSNANFAVVTGGHVRAISSLTLTGDNQYFRVNAVVSGATQGHGGYIQLQSGYNALFSSEL